MAEPIVSIPAELEWPPTIHDIQGNGQASAVVADDGTVIVVKAHGSGTIGSTPSRGRQTPGTRGPAGCSFLLVR